jgi:hypothetical protein
MDARVSRALVALALGLVSAATAEACGDKLVGLGGGVPFARIHPQHYVGQIVLYARPDSELRHLDDRIRLGLRLQRDGHSVKVIYNDHDLDSALQGRGTDLILVDQKYAPSIKARLPAGSASSPMVLSLVSSAAPAILQADGAVPGCEFQVPLEESKAVATALQGLMTRRQAGAVHDCASNGRT